LLEDLLQGRPYGVGRLLAPQGSGDFPGRLLLVPFLERFQAVQILVERMLCHLGTPNKKRLFPNRAENTAQEKPICTSWPRSAYLYFLASTSPICTPIIIEKNHLSTPPLFDLHRAHHCPGFASSAVELDDAVQD